MKTESKKEQPTEFNLVVITAPKYFKVYEDGYKKISEKYPFFHGYVVKPNDEEGAKKLKDVKIDLVSCYTFNAGSISYFLKEFPSIKWVHSLGAGVENFLKIKELINNENIILSNGKGAYSENFGEAGICAMMYFSFNLYTYSENMKNKNCILPPNKALRNKKLLIIGYGNNGVCLAKKAKLGFNMKVVGVVRTMRNNIDGQEYTDKIFSMKDLPDQIINEADYIYATLPCTTATDNIFDKTFFSKMNKDAVFINIGRGNAVVEHDIAEALENNVIKGAVLDVTKKEPLDKSSELYNISPSKLLLTNHSLGVVDDMMQQGFEFLCKNLENYFKYGKPLTPIDRTKQY